MSNITTAKRYAKALFELAKEKQAIDEIKEQFQQLISTLKVNPELNRLLRHPQVRLEDKKELLSSILSGFHPLFLNFVQLMADKGREGIYTQTCEEFVRLSNQYQGIEEASVYSASPISESEVEQIAERFSKLVGKKIKAKNIVDKSLIGGLVVRIGDRLYDGSVKGKLDRLHKIMVEK